jgi:hypothetical protein
VFGVWFLVSGVVLWCHVRVRLPGELNVRHELIVNLENLKLKSVAVLAKSWSHKQITRCTRYRTPACTVPGIHSIIEKNITFYHLACFISLIFLVCVHITYPFTHAPPSSN